MKIKPFLFFLLLSIFSINAQNKTLLPEFNNKPAYFDKDHQQLIELEKSEYNTVARAKGLFSAESGYYMEGSSSNVKIKEQPELKFIIKVNEGVDPETILDLVQFDIKKGQRLFIISKAKIGSTKTTFQKIKYSIEKIKNGFYYIVVKQLPKGEYFFGTNDFMFAFSVD